MTLKAVGQTANAGAADAAARRADAAPQAAEHAADDGRPDAGATSAAPR